MSDSNPLNLWLTEWQQRLRTRTRWIGAVAIALLIGLFVLIAALVGPGTAYDNNLFWWLRIGLLAAIGVVVYFGIYRIQKKIDRDYGGNELEKRLPELDGEFRTWLQERVERPHNPLLGLIGRNLHTKLNRHRPNQLVSDRLLISLRAATAVAALGVVALIFLGDPGAKFGAQQFLAGWFLGDREAPQTIAVTPGDIRIKRGANLTIQASTAGFSPEQLDIRVQYAGGDSELIAMRPNAGGFELRIFGIDEGLTYVIEGDNVRSSQHRVEVVEVPTIESIRISYQYPDWTGLEPRVQEVGTRIQGVAGTAVGIEIDSDMSLDGGVLVINGEQLPLTSDALLARAELTLMESGNWYIATLVDRELVRLTDDYPLAVVDDRDPQISLVMPGGDRGATNIEEVPIEFTVQDDFRVESLALMISVNAGAWQRIDLPAGDREISANHLLYLEEFAGDQEGIPELIPGDLISWYIAAGDHRQEISSDIYFIDVQPFDKRYSRNEGGANMGGAAGAGGAGEDEISRRQREILAATWNLQKQSTSDDPRTTKQIEDNALMLSDMQRTLAEQTDTTLRRLDARRLLVDPQAQAFAENLTLALEAMRPAADHLQDAELDASVPPQQKALQHLLRAEAQFRDIQVSMESQQAQGGGQQGAQRDLSEIYALEMDMSRNQYQTRQRPTLQEPQAALEDAFSELEELARRQEALAERARRDAQMSLSDRWQQEQLQREAERLREQLDQLQQQSGDQQSASQQQAADQLRQNLDEIIEDMRQASESGQPGTPGSNGGASGASDAAASASDQLQRTLDQLSEARQQQFRESTDDLARQTRELEQRQAGIQEQLAQALETSLDARRAGEGYTSGLDGAQERELAEQKREMSQQIADITRLSEDLSRNFSEQLPESADALQDVADLLNQERLGASLADAAQAIEYGMAPQVSVREFMVADALQRLRQQAERAAFIASTETVGERNEPGQDPGREIADLRRQLTDMLPQTGAAEGQGNAQGQVGQAGGANGDNGLAWGGGRPLTLADQIDAARARENATEVARRILNLSNELMQQGISDEQIIRAQQAARQLASGNQSDAIRIAESVRALISQLESLELALSGDTSGGPGMRPRPRDGELDEESAEYFRNLSESSRR